MDNPAHVTYSKEASQPVERWRLKLLQEDRMCLSILVTDTAFRVEVYDPAKRGNGFGSIAQAARKVGREPYGVIHLYLYPSCRFPHLALSLCTTTSSGNHLAAILTNSLASSIFPIAFAASAVL